MIELFRQRDFGNKINATFQYVTQNFRSLGMALLYIVGPVALLTGIASGIMQSNMFRLMSETANTDTQDPMAAFQMMSQFFSPSFWIAILFGILSNVAVILTTYAHMKVYERTKGGPISVTDVWTEVQPMIGRALVITLLNSIIIGVGFMFFFIPGIYLAVVLSLSLAVTAFEGMEFGPAWSRCFQLIRDKWWSTFGLIFVVGLIVGLVGLIFAIPTAIIAFFTGAKMVPDVPVVWLMAGNVINIVGRTLLNVIIYTAIGFQYTNLVERQEGRGMISAIDSIGTPPTQPRPSDEGSF
jgi:MFS family permease